MNQSTPHLKSNNAQIADLYSNHQQQPSQSNLHSNYQYGNQQYGNQPYGNQQQQYANQQQQYANPQQQQYANPQQSNVPTHQKANFFVDGVSRLLNNNYDTMGLSSNMSKMMEENAQLKQHLMIKDSELSRMALEMQHLHSKSGQMNEAETAVIEERTREEMKEKLQKAANEIELKMQEYKKEIQEQKEIIDSLASKNEEFLKNIQQLEQTSKSVVQNDEQISNPNVEQILQSHKKKWEEQIRLILAETLIEKENEFNTKIASLEEFIEQQKQENDALKSYNEKLQGKLKQNAGSNTESDEKYTKFTNEISELKQELLKTKADNEARLNQEIIAINEHFDSQLKRLHEENEMGKQELIRLKDEEMSKVLSTKNRTPENVPINNNHINEQNSEWESKYEIVVGECNRLKNQIDQIDNENHHNLEMMKDAAANKITGIVISHKAEIDQILSQSELQISNIETKSELKEKEHYNQLSLKDTEIETLQSKYKFLEQNICQMRNQTMDVFNEQTTGLENKLRNEKEQSEKNLREKYNSLLQEKDCIINQKDMEISKITNSNEKSIILERNSLQEDSKIQIAQLNVQLGNGQMLQSEKDNTINEQNEVIFNLNNKIEGLEQDKNKQLNLMQQLQDSLNLEKSSLENKTKRDIEMMQLSSDQNINNLDEKIKSLEDENNLMANEIKNYREILQETQDEKHNNLNQNDETVQFKDATIKQLQLEKDRLENEIKKVLSESEIMYEKMHNTEIEDTLLQNEICRIKTELEMTKDQQKMQNCEIGKLDLLSTEYNKLKIELENTRHELKMNAQKNCESQLLTNELERVKTEFENYQRSERTSRSRDNDSYQNHINAEQNYCKPVDSCDQVSSTRYETSLSQNQVDNLVYNGKQNHLLQNKDINNKHQNQNIIDLPNTDSNNIYIRSVEENSYQSVKIYNNYPSPNEVNYTERCNNNIKSQTPDHIHKEKGLSSKIDFSPNSYSNFNHNEANSYTNIENSTTNCEKYPINIDKHYESDPNLINKHIESDLNLYSKNIGSDPNLYIKNLCENNSAQHYPTPHEFNYEEQHDIGQRNLISDSHPEKNIQDNNFPEFDDKDLKNISDIMAKYEQDVKNTQKLNSRSNSLSKAIIGGN